MKVWWVFAYDQYYPGGGLGDLLGAFETEEEAGAFAAAHKASHSWALDYYDVENVSGILNGEGI